MASVDNYCLVVTRLDDDTDSLILQINKRLLGGEFCKAQTRSRKNLEIEIYYAALNYEPLDVVEELKKLAWGEYAHVLLTYMKQDDDKLTVETIADTR